MYFSGIPSGENFRSWQMVLDGLLWYCVGIPSTVIVMLAGLSLFFTLKSNFTTLNDSGSSAKKKSCSQVVFVNLARKKFESKSELRI